MTVRELYEYAFNNSLLDEDANNVIKLFNNVSTMQHSNRIVITDNSYNFPIEWSIEDVLKLFSDE